MAETTHLLVYTDSRYLSSLGGGVDWYESHDESHGWFIYHEYHFYLVLLLEPMAACRSDGLYKASTAVVLINQSNAVYCTQSRQLTRTFYRWQHAGAWVLKHRLSSPPTSPSRRQDNMDRASQVLRKAYLLACLNHIVLFILSDDKFSSWVGWVQRVAIHHPMNIAFPHKLMKAWLVPLPKQVQDMTTKEYTRGVSYFSESRAESN
jgi:hypothetical protein